MVVLCVAILILLTGSNPDFQQKVRELEELRDRRIFMATAFREFEVCSAYDGLRAWFITVFLVTSYEQLRKSLRENGNKLYKNLR